MGMGQPKTRTLTMTYQVKDCLSCPALVPSYDLATDDWCKVLKAFLWYKPEDQGRVFPVQCPLKEDD